MASLPQLTLERMLLLVLTAMFTHALVMTMWLMDITALFSKEPDWKEDALRRDFTINAIYVDIQGRIFDPLNGISDLQNGVVKFIGTSDERIWW